MAGDDRKIGEVVQSLRREIMTLLERGVPWRQVEDIIGGVFNEWFATASDREQTRRSA